MQQQQKQQPQTEDWQTRLAERMASKEWKDSDPVLESLTPEEAAHFLLNLARCDRKWLGFSWLTSRYFFLFLLFSSLSLWGFFAPDITTSKMVRSIVSGLICGIVGFIANMLFPKSPFYKAALRRHWISVSLTKVLAHISDPHSLVLLIDSRRYLAPKEQKIVEDATVKILVPMSGEAVFALPFPLRAQLATLAEQRETPQELSIAILLALTSARDGNVQPVLRRMSKDARSLRLREVAAECLREFSASP